MEPAAIYDIETEDWTRFVLGVIYYPQTKKIRTFRWGRKDSDECDMARELLAIDGEIVAHNGGRFDHLWFLDALAAYDLIRPGDIVSNGQGIVQLRIGDSVFVDSMKIFPMSLKTLTAGGKENLSDLCDCGKDCGGFCAIRRDASKRILDRVEHYCVADCVELGKALDHFAGIAETVGLELGRTIGATAWRSAKRDLSLPPAEFEQGDWARIREGYHGGRAELFRTQSKAGFAYDVNSMYPYTLASTPLPVGWLGAIRHGKSALADWNKGRPGVYQATVLVPEMFIPPLPIVLPDGLSFPFGKISGAWPRPELEYAESLGAKILRVHASAAFARTELIFAPWVEKLFAARMKFGKSTREGKWLKLISNSLTGKLGSRSERRSIKLWPDLLELRVCECEDATDCNCGAFKPLDMKGRIWEAIVSLGKVESCAHAEWAAYLTGAARVKLHKQLVSGGENDATYCDTDSCWSENPRTENIGKKLGEWEPKGAYRNFESLGPKTYHAEYLESEVSEANPDGSVTAAKGIPNPDWESLKAGKPQKFRSIRGLRRAKQGEKFFEMLNSQRIVTPNTGRRTPGPGGLTLPPRLVE